MTTKNQDRSDVRERLERLEGTLLSTEHRRRLWKKGFVAAAAAFVLSAAIATAAIVSTNNSFTAYGGETYTFGEDTFTLTPSGILLAALPQGSAGTSSGSPIELAPSAGVAREALSIGDWYYQVVVAELAVDTLPDASGTFEAELFLDGVSQGSLFFEQATGDDVQIESVTLRWNLGSSLPGSGGYVVEITPV